MATLSAIFATIFSFWLKPGSKPVDPTALKAMPPNTNPPPSMIALDTLLGELAGVLPIGRGHYACVLLQGILEGLAPTLWPASIQAKLAERGITITKA